MSTRVDSHIIEHHDDGTWTETTVVHGAPATKKEKAAAGFLLASVAIAPFIPVFYLIAAEKWVERQERKAEAKKLKSV